MQFANNKASYEQSHIWPWLQHLFVLVDLGSYIISFRGYIFIRAWQNVDLSARLVRKKWSILYYSI